ncbi:MAG: translocation/assembly module TamB domain-containing protein [Chitinophagaceae bacterium]
MSSNQPVNKIRRPFLVRLGRLFLIILLVVFILIGLVILLVQTPYVQNIAREKAQDYLSGKLKTKVVIGKLYIGFPQTIELNNIYLEDLQKDTLLSGDKLRVEMNMWKLLHSEVAVNNIQLQGITAKLKRQLPDTSFNFQFIADAFASKEPSTSTKNDTSSLKISLQKLLLDKIRLVYNDVVTGNDMEVWIDHSDTRIDKIDLNHMEYIVPLVAIKGVKARIYQNKPLQTPPENGDSAKNTADAQALQLVLKKIDLSDISLDYKNNVSALYSSINLGELKGDVQDFDMNKQVILLNNLQLNNTTASVRIGKQQTVQTLNKKVEPITDSANAGWRLQVANISLANNNIRYDDDSKARVASGMDYSHINAQKLTIAISNLLYSKDSIAGNITKGSMQEQSGFTLNNLRTQFLYANNQAYLKDLSIQTPGSSIQRSLQVSYPSIEALQKDLSKMNLDLDLANSKIQVKDILLFAPFLSKQAAFKNPNTVLLINSHIKGNLSNLNIPAFQFSGLQNTSVDVAGTIKNATDPKRVYVDLNINNISTSKKDILSLAPPKSIPSNITLPEKLSVSGKLKGSMDAIVTDLKLQSSLGNAAIKGSASKFTDKRNALYDLSLVLTKLNLGVLLKDTSKTFGLITASARAKGRGYDPHYANATLHALVSEAELKQYNYQHFVLDAKVANQQLDAVADMHDPNLAFALDASGSFATQYPSVKLNMQIDTIRTLPLHLTTDTLFYQGNISANFPVTQPDSLEGNLLVTKSVLINNKTRIPMDTVAVEAGKTDSGQFVHVRSDIVALQLNGQYKLTQMGSVFSQAMEPYFSRVADSNLVKTDPYNFTVNGTVVNKPLLKALIPAIDSLKTITLQSHFTSTNGWNAKLDAPLIMASGNKINNLQVNANTEQDKLIINAAVANVQSGSTLNVYATSINASIAHNVIDFSLLNKDKTSKNKYRLAGLVEQPQKGWYAVSLKPDSMMLNYDKWTVNKDNKIVYDGNGVNISKFELGKDNQLLSVNSTSPAPDAPLDISFKDFKLSTLSAFVKQDSLFIDGTLNGKAEVNDLMKQPNFTSDLTINNLAMSKDTLGDLHVQVNNTQANTFAADVKLSGRGNDVQLNGSYYMKPNNQSSFDLTANINQLQLHTLEGATNQAIKDATGMVNGKLSITGNLDKPLVNGDINFDKTRFNLGMLNSYFNIDQEKITVNPEGIHFDTFTIADSAGNKAVLDGNALTSDFRHYKFDLTLKAKDFHALNTDKKSNSLYYGQLYFSTNLTIKGTEAAPAVDGSLTVNDKTKLTVVLPQPEPGIEERDGIIKFVNANAPPTDYVLISSYDSLNQATARGMDVSVNIEVKKEAMLSLVIDEGNGDLLNVQGEASLNAGIDPSGKITLTGSYELESGSYELTFNLLKRKFEIQKGSKITWKGEPTQADVDITAVYIANTAPLDLVKDQLEGSLATIRNTYLQKLPFEVDLKMKGDLLKPLISFDILLPDNKNYNVSKNIIELVNEKLTELRKEPSELNKQVFALLLLTRFVTENPFQSSGSSMTAESFARASVSKLLTEQLNQLASDLIKGVDINFDVVSQDDDYSTGTRQSKTDLNVALSKRLLNDRLTVTVGSNFELEGAQNTGQQTSNIAGNVSVDYRLSKDGRYLLRAYRKNDYQGVIDGYVIETGIGFILTIDYNKFREIFQSAKQKEKLREQRRAKRQQNATTSTGTKTNVND